MLTLHPLDSRHITDYNKKLLGENDSLKAKIVDLNEQIKTMRYNYNKELNNQYSQEMAAKKRIAKMEKAGLYNMKDVDEGGLDGVHFFDATDGIDPDIVDALNQRLQVLKDKFKDWQVKQLEYNKHLMKKVHMYESLNKEFYGIISMSLTQIFDGVKLMEEKAEDIWEVIVKTFGHEFFLPVISKNYGHLYVNDTKRHQEVLARAIEETAVNEKALTE